MNKLYLGIDSGSIYTKGVIIDKYDNILVSSIVETKGEPIVSVKEMLNEMVSNIDFTENKIVAIGVLGVSRKLVGMLLDADLIVDDVKANLTAIKKEIPNVKTVIEIGGEHAKLLRVNADGEDSVIVSNSCLVETGSFLNWLVKKMNLNIDDVSKLVKKSKNDVMLMGKCGVFLETEITQKLKDGYHKEDILVAVSKMIAINYFNNVIKSKKIDLPIVVCGGVARNKIVVKELERLIGSKIKVLDNASLMGAIGASILVRESGKERNVNLDIANYNISTKMINCRKCSNNCCVVVVYKNDKLINTWGNKCESGRVM